MSWIKRKQTPERYKNIVNKLSLRISIIPHKNGFFKDSCRNQLGTFFQQVSSFKNTHFVSIAISNIFLRWSKTKLEYLLVRHVRVGSLLPPSISQHGDKRAETEVIMILLWQLLHSQWIERKDFLRQSLKNWVSLLIHLQLFNTSGQIANILTKQSKLALWPQNF